MMNFLSTINEIKEVTGLSDIGAKKVLYYSGATYGLEYLSKFPLLSVQGEPSTGKTTILNITHKISKDASKFTGKGTSDAALRDELPHLGTAIIEEADNIKEDILFNRHDRSLSSMPYKQASTSGGYDQTTIELFGATALHRRDSLDSGALGSRSIEIHTAFSDHTKELDIEWFADVPDMLRQASSRCDWSQVKASSGSRGRDTWAPLMEFARAIGDEEFIDVIEDEIKKVSEELKHGREFEPKQLIYGIVLALSTKDGLIAEKVPLKEVSELIRREPEYNQYSSRKTSKTARDIGFKVIKSSGDMMVFTGGEENLLNLGLALNSTDEWISERVEGGTL